MRHRKAGRQFGRNTSHRRAMFRALTANLVAHERIETTDAKAKELRRVAERLITQARRLGEVAYTPHDELSAADRARRQAAVQQVAQYLRRFGVVVQDGEEQEDRSGREGLRGPGQALRTRPGGYTRIIKLGHRRGDNAPMAVVELVEGAAAKEPAAKDAKPKKAAKTEEAATE